MGIFSQNISSSLYTESVAPAYGYGGVDAGAKIKLESYQNDMALFTAIIESDFNSAKAEHDGYVNEAVAITEGTAGDIWNKIKEFFKKLWEKLKGMIQSFMVKFVSVFIRDNKELVKKYHNQMAKQLNDSKRKYADMEFKMTEGYYNVLTGKFKIDPFNSSSVDAIFNSITDGKFNANKSLEDLKEVVDNEAISYINKQCKIKISELSELKKELDDKYIGEKESYDGYTTAINSTVEGELTKGSTVIKGLEKIKRETDSACKKLIKRAEECQKEMGNLETPTDKDKEARAELVKEADMGYYGATITQSILTDLTTWQLGFCKGYLKEVRALYIKAVSRRATNESAELDSIIDEAVDFDVESIFETEVEADLNNDDLSAEVDSIDDIADEKCR